MKDMRVVRGWRKRISQRTGPGVITGAADDDPSGIATYAQAGASFGYRTLWVPVFATPLMAGVQEMCARIGIVTRHGLAGTMRRHYSRWLLYPVAVAVFAANTMLKLDAVKMLFWTAVMYGLMSPPLIAVVLHVANNEKVMGKWRNGRWENVLGIVTLVVMTLAGLGLLVQ